MNGYCVANKKSEATQFTVIPSVIFRRHYQVLFINIINFRCIHIAFNEVSEKRIFSHNICILQVRLEQCTRVYVLYVIQGYVVNSKK